MARGFRALTEVAGLSDEDARELVLGNWHKLNVVLRGQPSSADLRRLLVLEFNGANRPDILRRLRSSLTRAQGRDAASAMERVLQCERDGVRCFVSDLELVGLTPDEARTIKYKGQA